MKFAASLLASAALAVNIVIPAGNGQGPDPSQVYVNGLTYGGSGCPAGSVASSFANDRKTFTLIFDSFIASSGTGIPVTENRKNCQINVDMHYPQGWSYAIVSVDYRGYVAIPAGVTATQKANYYFSGQTQQVSTEATFFDAKKDIAKDYLNHNSIDVASIVWSPCGASANGNVNAQVRLTGTPQALAKGAQITVDSIDGKVEQIYSFQWKQC
ncbi:hypothetical protein HDV03_000420 [Kappamyces sp. JEL0829]|nr:hypothetical protein HDV03_000420 [Kappamyces sp. JEL0829]